MATVTHAVTKDATIAATTFGAGKDPHLAVGSEASATVNRRAYLQFSVSKPADQLTLTSAKLYIRGYAASPHEGHDTPDSNSPHFYVSRVDGGSWSEGTTGHAVGTPSHYDNNGGGITWDNKPGTTDTGRATGTFLDGAWCIVDITAIVAWWDANPTRNYGIRLAATGDGTDMLFFSRETSSDAYILRTYVDNAPPVAPVISEPVDGAYTNTGPGTDIYIAGGFADPNPADVIGGVQVQLFASTATDAIPGTPVRDVTYLRAGGAAAGLSWTDKSWRVWVQGLNRATAYRFRAKVRDNKGAWGPFSTLDDHLVTTNALPSAPVNLSVDPGSLTPHVYGTIVDADPDATIGGLQEQWVQDVVGGTVSKWDSGQQSIGGSSTRYDVTYGGADLEWGVAYRRRARIADQHDQYGDWSAWQTVLQVEATGPQTLTPRDVNTRQTLTPTVTIGNSPNFDQYEVEVHPGEDATGTPTWSSGVVGLGSTASTTTSVPTLQPGRTYWLRARIRITGSGTIGPWSSLLPFYTAAVPGVPANVSPFSPLASSLTLVDTITPTVYATWASQDLETYGIHPSVAEVQVETADGVTLIYDGLNDTPPDYTVPMAWYIDIGTITWDTDFRYRWRFTDPISGAGPWSGWLYFRPSQPPTVTVASPADHATVTDPTPVLAWTYASGGSHAQAAFRVTLTVGSDVALDTGIVVSSAAALAVPVGILDTALTFAWIVDVWDVQGLTGSMAAAEFDTAFTVPAAPTGLTATPDPIISAVELAWDASGVAAAEFYAWLIYRRNDPDAGYQLVATITDQATLAYTDYGAAFRPNIAYRLTQSNGWAESDSADAVAALTSEQPGAWVFVVPGEERYHLELMAVEGGAHGADQPSERYIALGRGSPIVEFGPLSGETGSVSAALYEDDRHLEGRLREMADLAASAIFKTPYGDAWTVRLGSVRVTPGPGAVRTVTIDWQQTE